MNRAIFSVDGRIWRLLGVTLLAGGCSAVERPESVGASHDRLSNNSQIVNTLSGRCLNSKGGVTTPGQWLQLYGCVTTPNELFSFTAAGELRLFDSTVCIEPQDRSLAPGKQLVLAASCDGTAVQKWQLNGNGSISSTTSPNLCFDLSAGSTASQTPIVLATCSGAASQAFTTQGSSVPPPTALIYNAAAADRCLNVKGNSTAPGQLVQIYGCEGQDNEKFAFSPAGELRVFSGTRCLEPESGAATVGSRVISTNCTGSTIQQWRLNGNGTISSPSTNVCFDLAGGSTNVQTLVVLAACSSAVTQKWTTTGADTQAPTVPGSPTLSNLTCNSATFSWTASTDNVGVVAYDVYHDGQQMKSVSGSTLSTTLTLTPGASWNLYVNARDASGNVSQGSAIVPVKVPQCQSDTQPPTQPQGLSGSASGTSVTLSWTASTDNVGVTAYDVYRGGSKVGATATTTFVDSGLSASTTYQYYVIARDAQANTSTPSSTLSVTTGGSCASAICSVTQIGTDTDIPWGLVTLSDGTVLYTRRDAQNIVNLNPTTGQKTSIGTVPNVEGTQGEGGLMGLELSPTFASDRWLYIMHTSPTDNRIVRIKYTNGALDTSSEQVLLTGIARNVFHNGGRLRFGPDGKLYATAGDGQNGANAQSLSSLNGKVLRINPDGSIPSDNPFGNAIWSYGHRNPQGLAFDSQGRLWEQEFGETTWDETNLIQRGGNYGWPACEGTSSVSGNGCATAGFIEPKYTYRTWEGSCSGIAIVRDVLYVACERGTRLYREVISGSSLINVEQFFVGTYGRLRTVEPAPGGNLWLTTTNNGDKDSTPDNSSEKLLKVLLAQ